MKLYADALPKVRKNISPLLLCPEHLRRLLADQQKLSPNIVLLCVGTDRIIGDSLGPIVGTMIEQTCSSTRALAYASRQLNVYGTLHHTVHALNLEEISLQIQKKHADCTVIAIDASLGDRSDIGSVFIRPGNLQPGAGVHKNLPQLGDITITGVAGEQSRHPYLTLQTVRLSTVVQMAEHICSCILEVCR